MHSAELTSNTGKRASTRDLPEDVIHLGEQVHGLLTFMQEPAFSEHLVSLTLTVESVLNMVQNVAVFLEDYLKPNRDGELRAYCLFAAGSPLYRRSCPSQLEKTDYGEFR